MISLTLSPRTRSRRRTAATAALCAVGMAAALLPAAPAGAQILRVPKLRSEPAVWAGLGVGYYQMNSVLDGRTSSGWRFGGGVQYRGSAEYAIGRASSVGLAATYANLPLRYVFLTDSAASANGVSSLGAHANVTSLMGTFHAGGGVGFHYVVDVGAGVTQFAKFRADGSGAALLPSRDTDFAFSVGTGFAYSPSASTEFFLVQDYGNTIHQRDNLPSDARTNVQQLTTRVGVRYGAGARRSR